MERAASNIASTTDPSRRQGRHGLGPRTRLAVTVTQLAVGIAAPCIYAPALYQHRRVHLKFFKIVSVEENIRNKKNTHHCHTRPPRLGYQTYAMFQPAGPRLWPPPVSTNNEYEPLQQQQQQQQQTRQKHRTTIISP
jgi:hypothetical protein